MIGGLGQPSDDGMLELVTMLPNLALQPLAKVVCSYLTLSQHRTKWVMRDHRGGELFTRPGGHQKGERSVANVQTQAFFSSLLQHGCAERQECLHDNARV